MTHHHCAVQPGHFDPCTIKTVSDIEEYISWVKLHFWKKKKTFICIYLAYGTYTNKYILYISIYTLQISHIARKQISVKFLKICSKPRNKMLSTQGADDHDHLASSRGRVMPLRKTKGENLFLHGSLTAPTKPTQKRTESFRDVERFWDIAGVFLFGFWLITFGLLVDCYLASFGWFLRWDLVVVKFGIRKENNWKRRILRRRLQSGPLRWL